MNGIAAYLELGPVKCVAEGAFDFSLPFGFKHANAIAQQRFGNDVKIIHIGNGRMRQSLLFTQKHFLWNSTNSRGHFSHDNFVETILDTHCLYL
jgi:hypothetical protein